ncbi:TonB-dependent receptor [Spirosoma utsteinense]|uniref:TonB-dependent receptor n=1 Tax=Spirosoma utsteinense TaxID=2585773 RepID=UPI0016476FF7|nr:TonB-dependent receptor [Spirosoma utsteinense]
MSSWFLTAILVVFGGHGLTAQSNPFTVAGSVKDTKGNALVGAHVALFRLSETTPAFNTSSAADGRYEFKNIPKATYYLKSFMLGFRPLKADSVVISTTSSPDGVYDVVMTEATLGIQAVDVVSRKQTIEMQNGKLIFNVQNSALSAGSSALDLLRRVPGVSLGQDDQIMLKGSSGLNVMVDGKMTYLSQQQLVQLLKGMNAENINKIEVITTPTAEFDAAGNAGIINFVMKKNTQDGYSLDIRSGVSKGKFWMVNENITGSYRKGRINLFGSIDFNTPHSNFVSTSGNSFFENGQPIIIRRENQNPLKIKFYTYKAGIDWQLSTKHRLSVGYNGYFDDFVKDNAPSLVKRYDATGQLLGSVRSTNYLAEPYHYDATNLSYTYKIDSLGKQLTADAHYISYRNYSDGVLKSSFQDATGTQSAPDERLQSHQPGTISIQSVKMDLVLPYPAVTLKAGVKFAYVTNDNRYSFDSLRDGRFIEASSMSNHFKYNEKISAVYGSGVKKLGKTSLEAGLRLESTVAEGYTVKQAVANSWNYTKLFPSLSIDHELDKNNKLNFSVSRRIDRPTYASLNPVRWYSDQYFFYSGNPYLKPEMAWLFSAGYTLKEKYVLTVSYSRHTNYISKRLVVEPGTNAIVSQIANFDKMERLDVLTSIPISLSPLWELQLTTGTSYTSYPIPLLNGEKTFSKWAASAMLNQQLKLPGGLNFELSLSYYSSELWGIYLKEGIFLAGAGIRKSFYKNKLDVRVSFNDFLGTNRYAGKSLTDYTDYQYYDKPDTRRVGVSVKYHFGGKLQSNQSRRIEEQDRL